MKKMVVTTKRQHVYPSLGGAVGPHQLPRMLPVRDIEVLLIKGYGVAEELKTGELVNLTFDNFNTDNEVKPDTTKPVIVYAGQTNITVNFGSVYNLPVLTATDDRDGNIEVTNIIKKGSTTVPKVDTQSPGLYDITFNATDRSGNKANPVLLKVTVGEKPDTTKPVIQYAGSTNLAVDFGATFTDPVVTATDDKDGTVTVTKVVKKGSTTVAKVDTQISGAYTITYTASDKAGNAATPLVINVTVKDKPAEQPAE